MKAYRMVGMKYRGTAQLVASFQNGEPLALVRERDNPHDRNAVQVWARDQHVAYIAADEVMPLAKRMDDGENPPTARYLLSNGWSFAEV